MVIFLRSVTASTFSMQILFVHQNFPGQYRYLARHFASSPGCEAYAIGERENVKRQLYYMPQGIKLMGYDKPREVDADSAYPVKEFANQHYRAQMLGGLLTRQKKNGLKPDIIFCHPGWGEGLFLKEFFPDARLIYFFEFYFRPGGLAAYQHDDLNSRTKTRIRNTVNLLALDTADVGVSPTRWQWQTHPEEYQSKIRVIHDGVDTAVVKPDPGARVRFGKSAFPDREFSAEDEIITFSVRNLEPSRGFDRYMRALPRLQKLRPNAWFIIVGGDETSYVKGHSSGKPWREVLLEEVGAQLDMSRLLFSGRVPYSDLLALFSISSLHIYMTIPFVLSWSMLEVMACGTPVLGSRTGPVEEVIEDGVNGFLFDYFSEDELVEKVKMLMDDTQLRKTIGQRGREFIIENYDLDTRCLPQHLALVDEMLAKP
jgi:glycosyltransferase involved in cell wall biosynthesis